jgi:hypothetical protein
MNTKLHLLEMSEYFIFGKKALIRRKLNTAFSNFISNFQALLSVPPALDSSLLAKIASSPQIDQ